MSRQAAPVRRPNAIIALVLGLLTILLGVILGALSLITQKVEEVAEMPPEEEREIGVVYFIKGSDAPGGRWRRKRNQILRGDPGEIRFSDRDLNDWARNSFTAQLLKPEEEAADAEGESTEEATAEDESTELQARSGFLGVEVIPSPPNFAFLDGKLQIASYLELPALGSRKFVYKVIGDFVVNEDGVVRFQVENGTLGRAPIGEIPWIKDQLYVGILSLFVGAPEWSDLGEHWGKLESIRVDGEELVLDVR